MKVTKITVLVGAMMLLAAGTVSALNLGGGIGGKIGGAAVDVAHSGAKSAVENDINKNLAAKNCSFAKESVEPTCDLKEILNTLKKQKTIAEKSGFASNVDIYARIGQGNSKKNKNLGEQRTELINTELMKKVSWWDWRTNRVPGDGLELTVKIN
jgi:hypothetical protein